LPLWGACAIALVAYAIRSVSRGFDFRPDLPSDLLVLVLFLAVLAVVGVVRRHATADEPEPSDADVETDATDPGSS